MKLNFLRLFVFHCWVILCAVCVRAENNAFGSLYYQIKNNQYCLLSSSEDAQHISKVCQSMKSNLNVSQINAHQTYEFLVFNKAAENQILKNQCLVEQMKAMTDPQNTKYLSQWIAAAQQAWLVKKQARLLTEGCVTFVEKNVDRDVIREMGYIQSLEKLRKIKLNGPNDEFWVSNCLNKEKMQAAQLAMDLVDYTVPVLSQPSMYQAFEKNRSLIKNVKTNKAITDDDILKMKPLEFSNVVFTPSDDVVKKMNQQFSDFSQEREKQTALIKKFKINQGYVPLDHMKKFIYEDGTLLYTLQNLSETNENFKSLNQSSTEMSKPAFCLLSKYEPSLPAELANFFGESIALGSLFKIFGSIKLLGQSIKGTQAVMIQTALKSISRACLSDGIAQSKKIQMTQTTNIDRAESIELMQKYGSAPESQITFTKSETPTCYQIRKNTEKNMQNSKVNLGLSETCAANILQVYPSFTTILFSPVLRELELSGNQ